MYKFLCILPSFSLILSSLKHIHMLVRKSHGFIANTVAGYEVEARNDHDEHHP